MECNKQVSQRLHLPLGHKIFELIRLRLVDDDPILIEAVYIDCVRYSGIERIDFEKESLYNCLEKKFGTIVRKGQEQLGITYATEKEAQLLGIQAESPLVPSYRRLRRGRRDARGVLRVGPASG